MDETVVEERIRAGSVGLRFAHARPPSARATVVVLGANGAGKSTLLRIMAGLDPDFSGEAWAAEGVKVGFLPQEPQLNPEKDVMGNVMEGVGETKALLDRFDEVSAKFAEPLDDDEMNALMEEQGHLQEQIDACNGW